MIIAVSFGAVASDVVDPAAHRERGRNHVRTVGLCMGLAILAPFSLARNYISCTRDKGHHTRQTRSIFKSTRYTTVLLSSQDKGVKYDHVMWYHENIISDVIFHTIYVDGTFKVRPNLQISWTKSQFLTMMVEVNDKVRH